MEEANGGRDGKCCVGAPIPLAAPNTHCGIEGGYGERIPREHATAFEGSRVRGFGGLTVRGFEGSNPGPHPEGIIGPWGLVTSKRSSPGANI